MLESINKNVMGKLNIATKFEEDVLVISLEDLNDANKLQIREIITNDPTLESFTNYINKQNLLELYEVEGKEDFKYVGYVMDNLQFNFIRALEDSKYFVKDKVYPLVFPKEAEDGNPDGLPEIVSYGMDKNDTMGIIESQNKSFFI